MKTLRITFTKDLARAVCLIRYRETSWPEDSAWEGDRKAFRLGNGSMIHPKASLELLEETVAHQARQCGASFEIEDLGGEVVRWTDEVIWNESIKD